MNCLLQGLLKAVLVNGQILFMNIVLWHLLFLCYDLLHKSGEGKDHETTGIIQVDQKIWPHSMIKNIFQTLLI